MVRDWKCIPHNSAYGSPAQIQKSASLAQYVGQKHGRRMLGFTAQHPGSLNFHRIRIQHMLRSSMRKIYDVLKRRTEIQFVAIFFHIAQMR